MPLIVLLAPINFARVVLMKGFFLDAVELRLHRVRRSGSNCVASEIDPLLSRLPNLPR